MKMARAIFFLAFLFLGASLLFYATLFQVVLAFYPETSVHPLLWMMGASMAGVILCLITFYVGGCHTEIPSLLKESPMRLLFHRVMDFLSEKLGQRVSFFIEPVVVLFLAWGYFFELPITFGAFCFCALKNNKGLVR